MLLDEFMQTAEGIIAIGASSGFIFIGTREQYEEEIDKAYKKAVTGAKETLKDAEARLEALKRGGFNDIEICRSIPETTDVTELSETFAEWRFSADKLEKYAKLLKAFTERYESAAKSKARAERILSSKPYREREIKEKYKAIRKGQTNIIIEGDENGRFWSLDEAEEARHGR